MRTIIPSTLLAAAVVVPLGAVQSATAGMHAKLAGVVTKEDMAKHTVTLKTTTGKTFVVYTNKATKYAHLRSFASLKKGLHVAVTAQIRESDHTYWALSIAKM
jgi:hypothetical protein